MSACSHDCCLSVHPFSPRYTVSETSVNEMPKHLRSYCILSKNTVPTPVFPKFLLQHPVWQSPESHFVDLNDCAVLILNLLSVCFSYAKKRGCGTGFGELAPADLSQYFQTLNFADGGTWSTGFACGPPPSSPPSSLPQGGWSMSSWSADGSRCDGDHLGWQGEMSGERGATHRWQEHSSAPYSIRMFTGPYEALTFERMLWT